MNVIKRLSVLGWHFDRADDPSRQYSLKTLNPAAPEEAEDKRIVCAQCQALVTLQQHAIEKYGQHRHTFCNPAGLTFNIVLYDQVNCLLHGDASSEHSWFIGYAWRVVLCAQCQQHLGWSFHSGESPDFYGLIAERIIEINK